VFEQRDNRPIAHRIRSVAVSFGPCGSLPRIRQADGPAVADRSPSSPAPAALALVRKPAEIDVYADGLTEEAAGLAA
jgi:hypothetical protein